MMGLPDGPKSFKIGLVVLIQYRLWRTASHPDRHVAIAKMRYAIASCLKRTGTAFPLYKKNGNGVSVRSRPTWTLCISHSHQPWTCRWIYHYCLWRMAGLTPDIRLPFQLQSITSRWYMTEACVWTTCPGLHPKVWWLGVKPVTWWSQVQRRNHYATKPHALQYSYNITVA